MHLKRYRILFFLIVLLSLSTSWSWSQGTETYELNIRRATGVIELDGNLKEEDWKKADVAKRFFQTFPFDTAYARTLTEVMVTYDAQNIYIGARCFDENPADFVVQSLKRDFSYPITDAFAVYLDPFNDKANGFSFAVSPLGVQREGLLENGGEFGVTTSWDNRWFSEVKVYEDRWEVEMAIPFKSIRYNEGNGTWGINFSRNNLKANENSAWVPVPRNLNIATLAYTGAMLWDEPPAKAGTNISLIPYVLGRYSDNFESNEQELRPNVGADVKIGVTSALNLDLTVNPDFSQVEVDRQVTNLDRFSLFFPERRQFFIENSDLFGQFGFSRIRPFFSRRIGLQSGQAIPIIGGARLSGKLNPKLRIGLLNMQTEGGASPGLRSENFTVATFQQQVFARSNIGGIFVNRQSFDGEFKLDGEDYNRVAGLDFNLYSKDAKWRGKGFYHHSWDDQTNTQKSANAVWLRYNTREFRVEYNHEFVDDNYNAEVGFVPRVGYFRFEPNARYNFFPAKGPVLTHGPVAYSSVYWSHGPWQLTDRQLRASYTLQLRNRTNFEVGYENWFLYLTFPFDPTRSGLEPLPDSTGYNWQLVFASYESDFRKPFNVGTYANYGGYYTGERFNWGGEVNYRAQPWGIFGLNFEYNRIALPDTTVNLLLFSPRLEFSFTRSLFFTTFFQLNTQTNNLNINARLQWRFKPMSDLFLVLTDNYFTREGFGVRNRAIVLKLNYWFTL